MKNLIVLFIVNLITAIPMTIVTLDYRLPIAFILTALVYYNLIMDIYGHIKCKVMPKTADWIGYASMVIANIFVVPAIHYKSWACMVIAIIFYLVMIAYEFYKKARNKNEKVD